MRQISEIRGPKSRTVAARVLLLVVLFLFAATPLFADSQDENLKPLDADKVENTSAATNSSNADATLVSPELEKKYRAELESRLAQERESYESSLRSLWLANSAVWACLLGFIIFQAIAVRKRAAELAQLKAQREEK